MKELSIEEKAKAYDEAKARMSKAFNSNRCTIGFMNEIFPELKESEDERIMKEIIDIIDSYDVAHLKVAGLPSRIPKYIAWLEKQGEQKSEEVDNLHNYLYGEQKPAAKYKVGDTVYYDSFGRLVSFVIANIVEDGTDNPMYEDKDGNSIFQNDIVEQKPAFEMKTPEESLGIDSDTYNKIVDECIYEDEGKNLACSEEDEVKDNWEYIQDFIKKLGHFPKDSDELNVLINYVLSKKQKPAWSEEDISKIDRLIMYFKGKDNKEFTEWFSLLKDRVIPQPKQEWSEEDEKMCQETIDWFEKKCFPYALESENPARESIKWLKSLRPQNRWKPSDEQMVELRRVISGCSYDIEPLIEMEEELKKLREEKL